LGLALILAATAARGQALAAPSASLPAPGAADLTPGRKAHAKVGPPVSAAVMAERQIMITSPTPGVAPVCKATLDPEAYVGSEDYLLLLPGKNGWLFRSKMDVPTEVPVSAENVANFQRLQKILRRQGTELVLALQPNRLYLSREYIDKANPLFADVDPRRQLLVHNGTVRRLQAAGLLVPDVMGAMNDPSIPPLEPATPLFWNADHHWRPAGARYAALAVARLVKASPAYAGIPKKDFVTKQSGTMQMMQTFQSGLHRVCGGQASFTEGPSYSTTSVEASSLLGDEQPRIVLVGTSFSRHPGREFNFDGFLSEFLHADVQNEAISGGGFDQSIQAYLLSDSYKDFKPTFVIWEFGHHGLPIPTAPDFNWVLGAAEGDCKSPSHRGKAAPLLGGEQSLLRFPSGSDQADRIVIENTAADLRFFRVRARYADGKSKVFPFDASRWLVAPKKVILSLPNAPAALTEISFVADQVAAGSVTAHACEAVQSEADETLWGKLSRWFASLWRALQARA